MMTKRIFAALAVFALVAALPAVALADEAKAVAPDTVSTFEVSGMTCGGCSAAVTVAVKKLPGVADVNVSHEDGSATVKYDSQKVTADDIVAAIKKQGFEAKLEKSEKA